MLERLLTRGVHNDQLRIGVLGIGGCSDNGRLEEGTCRVMC